MPFLDIIGFVREAACARDREIAADCEIWLEKLQTDRHNISYNFTRTRIVLGL